MGPRRQRSCTFRLTRHDISGRGKLLPFFTRKRFSFKNFLPLKAKRSSSFEKRNPQQLGFSFKAGQLFFAQQFKRNTQQFKRNTQHLKRNAQHLKHNAQNGNLQPPCRLIFFRKFLPIKRQQFFLPLKRQQFILPFKRKFLLRRLLIQKFKQLLPFFRQLFILPFKRLLI